MAKMTVFSNRIYKDELPASTNKAILDILHVHNEAKIYAYACLAYNKPLNESLHLHIKDKFKLNTYYANYAVKDAEATISSNNELQKMYIKDAEDNIKTTKNKIKKTENKIKYYERILKHIIDISKAKKYNKKLPKLKKYKPYNFCLNETGKVYVYAEYNKKPQDYDLYTFEHKIVKPRIKQNKNKLNMLKRGLLYKENKLKKLKTKPIYSCFGTKDLFNAQYTIYKNDKAKWEEDFYNARHKVISLQGVNNVIQGNACVKYDYNENILSLQLPYENIPEDKKYHKAVFIDIHKVDFPYGKDLLIKALNRQNTANAWMIQDMGDYYIFKANIEIVKDTKPNYSKADGVIGYDINYDHIAWVETDSIGNFLGSGKIDFDLTGKSTGQSTKIIELKAIELVNIAKKKNKPLVGEDIKNIKKSNLQYGNKLRNKKITTFAYKKIIEATQSRAFKEDVDVSYINPYNTSQIGKLKYMKEKGISVHTSAAYVIARKGLGYKEKLPNKYKHFGLTFKQVINKLKDVNIHLLYKNIDTKKYTDIKDYKLALLN